jgi:cystathionine beta-lyase
VWSRGELNEVLDIARRHQMIVLSDEIHADLVYPGYRHTALATLPDTMHTVITAVAPSKTFNIPGLALSALIVPDPAHCAALRKALDQLHVTASNPFSVAAFEAAYRAGEPWLESLLAYLAGTRDAVRRFLHERLPRIRLVEPEGTYLLWLDCRALSMDDRQLKHFFVHQAAVGMNSGTVFGEGGSGFMRLNIGAPRHVVIHALERIEQALEAQNNIPGKEHADG